jgi:hypothetical protein
MGNEPFSPDPLNIWQSQPTEPTNMNLEEVRQKVRELQSKFRRGRLASAAQSLVWIGLCVWGFVASFSAVQRTGFALTIVWILLTQLPLLQGISSAGQVEDAGASTGLEFCRSVLQRQRDRLRQPWRWYLGPIFLGIGTFLLGPVGAVMHHPGMAINMAPFLILLAAWVFFFFRKVGQGLRELQREIDELNALGRG